MKFTKALLVAALLAVNVMVALATRNGRTLLTTPTVGSNNFFYAIGLWGDLPYGPDQEGPGLSALIKDMNSASLLFTVHDGDMRQGSGLPLCNETFYDNRLAMFATLKAPAMLTPGDNDWTDCDRVASGNFTSRSRMDIIRQKFYSGKFATQSMGQQKMSQEVQTAKLCLNEAGANVSCVENRRWSAAEVWYMTLSVQGSCNNLCDVAPDPAEFAARNYAVITWLKESFAKAKANKARAIMIISQANPGFDQADPTRAPLRDPVSLNETDGAPDGFKEFLVALRAEVLAFAKPVVYVHGDSHYFRIDKPFLDSTGRRIQNFTRVETFGNNKQNGNNDMQWVRALVDPWNSREVFAFQPMVVPANA